MKRLMCGVVIIAKRKLMFHLSHRKIIRTYIPSVHKESAVCMKSHLFRVFDTLLCSKDRHEALNSTLHWLTLINTATPYWERYTEAIRLRLRAVYAIIDLVGICDPTELDIAKGYKQSAENQRKRRQYSIGDMMFFLEAFYCTDEAVEALVKDFIKLDDNITLSWCSMIIKSGFCCFTQDAILSMY